MAEKIYFGKGLFTKDAQGGVLLGSKCKNCEQLYFPPVVLCYECLKEEMETVPLSRSGKLITYTINYMPTTYFEPPNAVGWIELPEGVRVFAPLKRREEHLKVGMDMELVIEKLYEEEGKEIIGYKFQPVTP